MASRGPSDRLRWRRHLAVTPYKPTPHPARGKAELWPKLPANGDRDRSDQEREMARLSAPNPSRTNREIRWLVREMRRADRLRRLASIEARAFRRSSPSPLARRRADRPGRGAGLGPRLLQLHPG